MKSFTQISTNRFAFGWPHKEIRHAALSSHRYRCNLSTVSWSLSPLLHLYANPLIGIKIQERFESTATATSKALLSPGIISHPALPSALSSLPQPHIQLNVIHPLLADLAAD